MILLLATDQQTGALLDICLRLDYVKNKKWFLKGLLKSRSYFESVQIFHIGIEFQRLRTIFIQDEGLNYNRM